MTPRVDLTDEKLTELADNWRDGLTGDEVKALIAGCRRTVALESQLSTLTRLATAVVETWDGWAHAKSDATGARRRALYLACDALAAHIRNGGTGS